MCESICGLDCGKCRLRGSCKGCAQTNGYPFAGGCVVAECCKGKGYERCSKCLGNVCELKNRLIAEFNALGIEDMEEITDLNALMGSYINLEYTLPSGKTAKFLDDEKVYLGNQICKTGSARCYGLTADENFLLVCEYGDGGSDAEIVAYKKRSR